MLEDVYSILFNLLRIELVGINSNFALPRDSVVYDKLFSVSSKQGVSALVFDGLKKFVKSNEESLDLYLTKKQKLNWAFAVDKIEKVYDFQYKRAMELSNLYNEKGVRTLVLKGIVASKDYPIPSHRPCGDLDIFLLNGYEKGNLIAEQYGAKVDRSWYKHSHIDYKGLTVENHNFCTLIRGNKKIKGLEIILQDLLRESSSVIDDTCLEAPQPLFNALFLTYHAQVHYLSEGIAIRHLCDWAMFLQKHAHEVDWAKFDSLCKKFGMQAFANALTNLSHELIGVNIPERYAIVEDNMRVRILHHDILYGRQPLYSSKLSPWELRFQLITNLKVNSQRYQLFSDESYLKEIIRLAYGFVLDRKPTI